MAVENILRLDLHGVPPEQWGRVQIALVNRCRSFDRLMTWFAQNEALGPHASMRLAQRIIDRKERLKKPRHVVLTETVALAMRGGVARGDNPYVEAEAFWETEANQLRELSRSRPRYRPAG